MTVEQDNKVRRYTFYDFWYTISKNVKSCFLKSEKNVKYVFSNIVISHTRAEKVTSSRGGCQLEAALVIDGVNVLIEGLRAKLDADQLDWRSTFRRGQIYNEDGIQCRRQPSVAWRHGPDLVRFIKQVRHPTHVKVCIHVRHMGRHDGPTGSGLATHGPTLSADIVGSHKTTAGIIQHERPTWLICRVSRPLQRAGDPEYTRETHDRFWRFTLGLVFVWQCIDAVCTCQSSSFCARGSAMCSR